MRTAKLGSRGPDLSVIGFGAWEAGMGREWDDAPPEEQVVEAIAMVFEPGINWIDTAEVYGNGTSEHLVGRAVAGRRDEVSIATKVAPAPDGTGFRPDQVHEACRKSLERLSTDRIDLYQLHWPDAPGSPSRRRGGRWPRCRRGPRARDRGLELRSRADRALSGDPARRLAPAGVLDAGARRSRPDPLVRRAWASACSPTGRSRTAC